MTGYETRQDDEQGPKGERGGLRAEGGEVMVRPQIRGEDGSLVELTRDVRNALQGAAGAVELLRTTPLTGEQREYVGYVSEAVGALMDAALEAEATLAELAHVASYRASEEAAGSVERTLAVAREALGMDVAFTSEFVGGEQVYRSVEGDGASFGFREGEGMALEATFCQRVIDGRIPSVIPDAQSDERVSGLEVSSRAGIGSYIGLPLRFSDGRLYGTLCCLSHSPEPRLQERDTRFMEVLSRLIADQIEREERAAENRRLQVRAAGLSALLAVLAARDGYTADHSRRVVEYSVTVARGMGLAEEEVADVEQAAALHDVGKVGVPDAILSKTATLSEAEWEGMRAHAATGERIVASTGELAHLAPIIRASHERWDGEGYPDELSGEEIPVASRIILVCDAFEAMTSERPYRRALDTRMALEELKANAGSQFCPRTVEAFVEVFGRTEA